MYECNIYTLDSETGLHYNQSTVNIKAENQDELINKLNDLGFTRLYREGLDFVMVRPNGVDTDFLIIAE